MPRFARFVCLIFIFVVFLWNAEAQTFNVEAIYYQDGDKGISSIIPGIGGATSGPSCTVSGISDISTDFFKNYYHANRLNERINLPDPEASSVAGNLVRSNYKYEVSTSFERIYGLIAKESTLQTIGKLSVELRQTITFDRINYDLDGMVTDTTKDFQMVRNVELDQFVSGDLDSDCKLIVEVNELLDVNDSEIAEYVAENPPRALGSKWNSYIGEDGNYHTPPSSTGLGADGLDSKNFTEDNQTTTQGMHPDPFLDTFNIQMNYLVTPEGTEPIFGVSSRFDDFVSLSLVKKGGRLYAIGSDAYMYLLSSGYVYEYIDTSLTDGVDSIIGWYASRSLAVADVPPLGEGDLASLPGILNVPTVGLNSGMGSSNTRLETAFRRGMEIDLSNLFTYEGGASPASVCLEVVSITSGGTVVRNGSDLSYTFTPDRNFWGDVIFTVRASYCADNSVTIAAFDYRVTVVEPNIIDKDTTICLEDTYTAPFPTGTPVYDLDSVGFREAVYYYPGSNNTDWLRLNLETHSLSNHMSDKELCCFFEDSVCFRGTIGLSIDNSRGGNQLLFHNVDNGEIGYSGSGTGFSWSPNDNFWGQEVFWVEVINDNGQVRSRCAYTIIVPEPNQHVLDTMICIEGSFTWCDEDFDISNHGYSEYVDCPDPTQSNPTKARWCRVTIDSFPRFRNTISGNICYGDTVYYNEGNLDTLFFETLPYQDNITQSDLIIVYDENGCEEHHTLNLTFLRPDLEEEYFITLAEGSDTTIEYNGEFYELSDIVESGSYPIELADDKSVSGCPSILLVHVTIVPKGSGVSTIFLCAGEVYRGPNGETYTENSLVEIGVDTFNNVVFLEPVTIDTAFIRTPDKDFVLWDDNPDYQIRFNNGPGEHTYTIKDSRGCDSLIIRYTIEDIIIVSDEDVCIPPGLSSFNYDGITFHVRDVNKTFIRDLSIEPPQIEEETSFRFKPGGSYKRYRVRRGGSINGNQFEASVGLAPSCFRALQLCRKTNALAPSNQPAGNLVGISGGKLSFEYLIQDDDLDGDWNIISPSGCETRSQGVLSLDLIVDFYVDESLPDNGTETVTLAKGQDTILYEGFLVTQSGEYARMNACMNYSNYATGVTLIHFGDAIDILVNAPCGRIYDIVVREMSERELPQKTLPVTVCGGQSFRLAGQEFTQEGTYVVRVKGENYAIDTMVRLELEVLNEVPTLIDSFYSGNLVGACLTASQVPNPAPSIQSGAGVYSCLPKRDTVYYDIEVNCVEEELVICNDDQNNYNLPFDIYYKGRRIRRVTNYGTYTFRYISEDQKTVDDVTYKVIDGRATSRPLPQFRDTVCSLNVLQSSYIFRTPTGSRVGPFIISQREIDQGFADLRLNFARKNTFGCDSLGNLKLIIQEPRIEDLGTIFLCGNQEYCPFEDDPSTCFTSSPDEPFLITDNSSCGSYYLDFDIVQVSEPQEQIVITRSEKCDIDYVRDRDGNLVYLAPNESNTFQIGLPGGTGKSCVLPFLRVDNGSGDCDVDLGDFNVCQGDEFVLPNHPERRVSTTNLPLGINPFEFNKRDSIHYPAGEDRFVWVVYTERFRLTLNVMELPNARNLTDSFCLGSTYTFEGDTTFTTGGLKEIRLEDPTGETCGELVNLSLSTFTPKKEFDFSFCESELDGLEIDGQFISLSPSDGPQRIVTTVAEDGCETENIINIIGVDTLSKEAFMCSDGSVTLDGRSFNSPGHKYYELTDDGDANCRTIVDLEVKVAPDNNWRYNSYCPITEITTTDGRVFSQPLNLPVTLLREVLFLDRAEDPNSDFVREAGNYCISHIMGYDPRPSSCESNTSRRVCRGESVSFQGETIETESLLAGTDTTITWTRSRTNVPPISSQLMSRVVDNWVTTQNVSLNLSVTATNRTSNVSDSFCLGSSYIYEDHDQTFTVPGSYSFDFFEDGELCGTRVNLSLSTFTLQNTETYALCPGQEIDVILGGESFTISGDEESFFFQTEATDGCITEHTVTVEPEELVTISEEDAAICSDETFVWEGSSYSTAGTYFAQIPGTCEQRQLNLEVTQKLPPETVRASVCENEEYEFEGQSYPPGTHNVERNYGACEDFLTLIVDAIPSQVFTEDYSLCEGETVTVRGTELVDPGTYRFFIPSTNGCDDLLLVTIQRKASPQVEINDGPPYNRCKGQEMILNVSGSLYDEINWSSNLPFTEVEDGILIDTSGVFVLNAVNISTGCTLTREIRVGESEEDVAPEFLLPDKVGVGQSFIAADITFPKPQRIDWKIPEGSGITVIPDAFDQEIISFNQEGIYTIGMIAYYDDCQVELEKTVEVGGGDVDSGGGYGDSDEDCTEDCEVEVVDFKIAPNPNDGNFNLSIQLSRATDFTFMVFDFTVTPRFTKEYANSQFVLEGFSLALAPGTYIALMVTSEGVSKNLNFIVQ